MAMSQNETMPAAQKLHTYLRFGTTVQECHVRSGCVGHVSAGVNQCPALGLLGAGNATHTLARTVRHGGFLTMPEAVPLCTHMTTRAGFT